MVYAGQIMVFNMLISYTNLRKNNKKKIKNKATARNQHAQ